MKVTETKIYKKTQDKIYNLKSNINFLNQVKNSDLGKEIELFCSYTLPWEVAEYFYDDGKIPEEYEDHVYFPTEKYNNISANAISVICINPETNEKWYYSRVEDGMGYDIDDDIKRYEEYLNKELENKKILDSIGEFTKETTLKAYNKLLDKFQCDGLAWTRINMASERCVDIEATQEALDYYGITNEGEVINRKLYFINGKVYKASPEELEKYCKSNGCTAQLVEPEYLI